MPLVGPLRWAQEFRGAVVAAWLGSVAEVPMLKQAEAPLVLRVQAPYCVVSVCNAFMPMDLPEGSQPFYRPQAFVRTL